MSSAYGSTVGMMIMHTVVGVNGNIVSVRNHNDGKIYKVYCNQISPNYGSRPSSVKKEIVESLSVQKEKEVPKKRVQKQEKLKESN